MTHFGFAIADFGFDFTFPGNSGIRNWDCVADCQLRSVRRL
jgi:hypothetical protein